MTWRVLTPYDHMTLIRRSIELLLSKPLRQENKPPVPRTPRIDQPLDSIDREFCQCVVDAFAAAADFNENLGLAIFPRFMPSSAHLSKCLVREMCPHWRASWRTL
jgi:hypothetical protein